MSIIYFFVKDEIFPQFPVSWNIFNTKAKIVILVTFLVFEEKMFLMICVPLTFRARTDRGTSVHLPLTSPSSPRFTSFLYKYNFHKLPFDLPILVLAIFHKFSDQLGRTLIR